MEFKIENTVRIRRERGSYLCDPLKGHLESTWCYREHQYLYLLKRLIEEKLSEQFSTPVKIVKITYDLKYDADAHISINTTISTDNRIIPSVVELTVGTEVTNAYYDYWDSSTGELNYEGKQKLFDYVSKEDPAFVIEEAMKVQKHIEKEMASLQTQFNHLSNFIRKVSRFDWGIELFPECLKE